MLNMKWKFDWKSFFLVSGINLLCCIVIGAVFAMAFDLSMRDVFLAMLALFGVAGFIAAILEGASEKMREKNYAFGFGVAIHYGAAFLAYIIWDEEEIEGSPWKLLIAFLIAGSVAWIAWIKYFRDL